MKEKDFNSPVLFIIFNRPDTTDIAFAEIKKYGPKNYLSPQMDQGKMCRMIIKKCAQTREIIKK